MFFLVQLERTVKLHPKHFGPKLDDTLLKTISQELEGTCTGRYGFVVTTMLPDSVSQGIVDAASGYAHFTVKFKAIVCKPFKGEVLDAVVTLVTQNGFFAEAGPVQIFVSHKQMPADYKFELAGNPAFVNGDASVTIAKDDDVRVRIVGTRYDTNEIFSIGSIAGNFLGPIS